MVTSNKQPDKKIVKMADQNNGAVVPQRTLLGEVNEHITCPLCRGYYIDATTIVECLHSFCRSCIIKHLQVKSYCPVCEMMINSAKPNIKLDKALQDIVYKLVPGLFQREMERRQQFYASRPGPAASATPEQRGEDTERIIFSPEDVISFSLEYADVTDTDSISSKSSDSNDFQTQTGGSRRYLQCPAVVNISHLKKFLSMKFDIDSTQFAIVILYKKVPLPDYYTLMDIAYIYNWKRNEPMRFFYQIIDYVAIRNRLFDNNRKESHFPDRKSSPASTEDTNVSSPAPNLNDHGSEASSGTDSPMPENNASKASEPLKKVDVCSDEQNNKDVSQGSLKIEKITLSPAKKNDDEVEKSQFLNSFELTAKNNAIKCSPSQSNMDENKTSTDSNSLNQSNSSKIDDNLKRKQNNPNSMPEMKKLKIELEKTKLSHNPNTPTDNNAVKTTEKDLEINLNTKSSVENTNSNNQLSTSTVKNISSTIPPPKDVKQQITATKQQPSDNQGLKTLPSGASNIGSSKPKSNEVTQPLTTQPSSTVQKTVSPLKLQIPKQDVLLSNLKPAEANKSVVKKMPDLRPSVPMPQVSQNKGQSNQIGKFRMDLIANNSDLTTTDHTKTLPQVKTPLSAPIPSQTSGDPLKSLFDSCKINIPPSLSITLTDQKVEPRSQHETANTDQKKILNKNLASASNVSTHKAPSPPVHNYIEILKLPDTDPKKLKTDNNLKFNPPGMAEGNSSQSKPLNKPSESSTKGPIPNLKPISDTKLGKQSGNFSAPITFQQTFEQQLQSMQSEKKGKLGKNKAQVPKLVPATPKSFTAANKLNMSNAKAPPINIPLADHKLSAALDLSTPHNIQSQLSPQQTKAFETMQSIANLAKKHNMPNKLLPLGMSQANVFSSLAAMPISTVPTPLRIPSTSGITQPKIEKAGQSSSLASMRQEGPSKGNLKPPNNLNATIPTQGYPVVPHSSPNPSQTTPRPQTRSPSSSPKLVIAEEKQAINALPDNNVNQSNQITSTQVSNILAPKSESPKAAPGPSKPGPKPMKPMIPVAKMPGIRQPIPPSIPPMPKPNAPMASPADYLTQRQFLSAQHAMLRQQMDLHGIHFQNPWLKAQQQYDLLKNMSNMTHQSQNDFNKDKQ